jgi:hypothetical protein
MVNIQCLANKILIAFIEYCVFKWGNMYVNRTSVGLSRGLKKYVNFFFTDSNAEIFNKKLERIGFQTSFFS